MTVFLSFLFGVVVVILFAFSDFHFSPVLVGTSLVLRYGCLRKICHIWFFFIREHVGKHNRHVFEKGGGGSWRRHAVSTNYRIF